MDLRREVPVGMIERRIEHALDILQPFGHKLELHQAFILELESEPLERHVCEQRVKSGGEQRPGLECGCVVDALHSLLARRATGREVAPPDLEVGDLLPGRLERGPVGCQLLEPAEDFMSLDHLLSNERLHARRRRPGESFGPCENRSGSPTPTSRGATLALRRLLCLRAFEGRVLGLVRFAKRATHCDAAECKAGSCRDQAKRYGIRHLTPLAASAGPTSDHP